MDLEHRETLLSAVFTASVTLVRQSAHQLAGLWTNDMRCKPEVLPDLFTDRDIRKELLEIFP